MVLRLSLPAAVRVSRRGGLFRKYVIVLVTLVTAALLASGIIEIWFSYGENKASLLAIQNEQALGAAARIEAFVKEIERQMRWTTQPQVVAPEAAIGQRRIDFVRLLKQVPPITELSHLDATGKEQLLEHRLAMSVVGSQTDFSAHPKFTEARRATWFGPVYFRKESEPYMTIAMPVSGGGVTVAEVNLKFIWDVVSQIKAGTAGRAFVVDGQGQLIAHPDISLVLQKTSLASLPQVRAALAEPASIGGERVPIAKDIQGRDVLTAYTVIAPLRWAVFVEQPLREAFAPLRASITRTVVLVLLGIGGSLVASVLLVRRMVRPIHALQEGAARIGAGELGQRLDVRTGDEVEALAGEFNRMTERLQGSYATLERRVEERTQELSEALKQQTATAEILRVISSSPTDVRPVFEAITRSAVVLCDGLRSSIYRVDGDLVHLEAGYNHTEDYHRQFPMPLSDLPGFARVIAERAPAHVRDLEAEPWVTPRIRELSRGLYRSTITVPMIRADAVVGLLAVSRVEAGGFTDKQVELLKTFADQAVIAVENVRLFTELQEKNRAVTEALEQQTATTDILAVISSSPTEVQPVFEAIVTSGLRLFPEAAVSIALPDGELVRAAAVAEADPARASAWRHRFPFPLSREYMHGAAILDRRLVDIPDVAEAPAELAPGRSNFLASGYRGITIMPMIRGDEAIGALSVVRVAAGPLSDKELAVLKTFADQAVIAIQNVRLFTELQEKNRAITDALEQQTATAGILQVISSSPTDVQPVFDAIADSALRLLRGWSITVSRVDDERLRVVAARGGLPGTEAAVREFIASVPRAPGMFLWDAILQQRVQQIVDVERDDVSVLIREGARLRGWRASLAVPMMYEGRPIGVISVTRAEPGAFSAREVQLLQTFADQGVIAIENVRLFTELQEKNRAITDALEQQTATAEILRVISSSPTDVQPVFDTITHSAVRLCDAASSIVTTFDGDLIHVRAVANMNAEGADALRRRFPMRPGRDSAAARAIVSRAVVQIPDTREDADLVLHAAADTAGYRSVLAVPMIRDGHPIGAVNVHKSEPGYFTDDHVHLLKTFADQAVIAVENVRLFSELQQRTGELGRSVDQLTALGEVSRAVSSTLDLDRVLNTVVSRASQLAGADGCSIYEYDGAANGFRVRATSQLSTELADTQRTAVIPAGEGAVGRLVETREPVQIADIAAERAYVSPLRDALLRGGYRALLAVPMLHEERIVGGLVVSRRTPGEFPPETVELLTTFANQSALAIQNARLFREIEQKSAELEVANRHKSEFLASMSHELRTPLNAVIGFSEVLLERMFGGLNDKQEEYLRDIYSSGRHLLSLINDILDLAKIEAGKMELDVARFDLPQAIENAVTLVRGRADAHGIRLETQLDPRLGDFVGDERKVKQILLNLLSNAVKFTPEGGRITLRAAPANGSVEIAVADTGIGIAPEDQAAVFEEFRQVGADYARKREGTGLGLALTKRFVELHGGTIWLKSALGEGSTFTFTLPVRPWPTTSS